MKNYLPILSLFTVIIMIATLVFVVTTHEKHQIFELQRQEVTIQNQTTTLTEVKEENDVLFDVLDFDIDYPSKVVIQADRFGNIIEAGGPLETVGWTAEGLIGKKVEMLRPATTRERHKRRYKQSIVDESDEVFFYEDKRMLTEDGSTIFVNGCAFWHRRRQVMVSFMVATD